MGEAISTGQSEWSVRGSGGGGCCCCCCCVGVVRTVVESLGGLLVPVRPKRVQQRWRRRKKAGEFPGQTGGGRGGEGSGCVWARARQRADVEVEVDMA